MSRYNLIFGKSSENIALRYLKRQGYKILDTNYRTKLGEIDIIGRQRSTVCFIEVRSRSTSQFGYPKESVDRRKQNKIIKSAILYLKEKFSLEKSCRFDVLSIIRNQERVDFELIKGAFDLD